MDKNEYARWYYKANRERILARRRAYPYTAKMKRQKRKYHEKSVDLRLWFNAKYRAAKKGVPFTIRRQYVIVPNTCPVLGIPLKLGRGVISDNSPTLDRIRPELGYVPGNVQVISHRANNIKSNAATAAEVRQVADWMESHGL